MMDFMRKNSRMIMVFFGVLIMIGFVLPSAMFRGSGRNVKNKEVGTYAGDNGETTTLTSKDMGKAITEIKAMLDLKMVNELMGMGNKSNNFSMMNPAALLLTCHAVFGDNQTAYYSRSLLIQTIGNTAKDKAEFDALLAKVDKLIDTNQSPAVHYLALKAEANRNGFYATSEQVNEVVSVLRQTLNSQGQKMSAMLSNYGMTTSGFGEAVGNVIAIASYVDNLTKIGIINENKIRDEVRDSVEISNISGKYVEFSYRTFSKKVEEPTEEELIAHFEKYKNIDPQDIRPDDKDNPFGFSYMLPDRLKVEYLDVDVSSILNTLKKDFESQNIGQQEEILLEFWADHKTERPFQEPLKKVEGAPQEFRQKSFDEAYDTVKDVYLKGKARNQAESIIAKIREAASNENDLVEANIDWQVIAEKNSTDSVTIGHGESEFLSMETINSFKKFGSAKLTRFNNAPIYQMLFNCEPLRDRPATKLEQPPLKLRETLANIEAGFDDRRTELFTLTNLYLVRVIAVDKSRVAASINDDGRQGGSDIEPLKDDKNILKDNVISDLKQLKAYNMAKANAEEFKAVLADPETDLTQAIETFGKTLTDDPEAENAPNPLRESSVESLYNMINQMRYFSQQNPNSSQYYQSQINTIQSNLRNILDSYRDIEEGQKLIVENTNNFSVMVFDEIKVEPANQDDLAQRKAVFTLQAARSTQVLPMIDFFLHDNIIKRNDVVMVKDEEKSEADTEESKK